MHRRLRAAPFLPLLLLLLLLVLQCAGGCRAAADRRVFDGTVPKSYSPPAAVVREVPRKGQGAAQAYTVATAAGGKSNEGWAPIRIVVSMKDLEESSQRRGKQRYCKAEGNTCINYLGQQVTCKARDVLTEPKKLLYTTKIIPEAVKLHAERLLVEPAKDGVFVPRDLAGHCQHFTIPTGHRNKIVADADMVLYAAAGPLSENIPAWAATCVKWSDSRPSVGAMEFSPAYMTDTAWSVRVAAHELAHALGFSHEAMELKSMVESVSSVRGGSRKDSGGGHCQSEGGSALQLRVSQGHGAGERRYRSASEGASLGGTQRPGRADGPHGRRRLLHGTDAGGVCGPRLLPRELEHGGADGLGQQLRLRLPGQEVQ
ncbi:surface protease GP63 [Trypanosoma conorhini]|uniref:Leishmanolysin-like peptidase n=1 Tax=Trypanosoma conorhini TaxID=83891 RepID=A0A3R7M4K1_9TRYP|nr:surface protease GP63 [Trypanosoma conorhini]RNE96046.1 surface protease GP63 [Trypanosoma conorhini]